MSKELETVNLKGVEAFQSGKWNNDSYTEADLDEMIYAFDKVGFKPVIKIGHADGQEQLKADEFRKIFGAPSLGNVERIYRKAHKLYVDIANVPKHLADLINKRAYSRVSAEIYWNLNDSGKKFPRVFKALSFLGAEVPAITSLADLQALYEQRAGALCYDDNRNEFKVYHMEKDYGGMYVKEKDGKWCVYGPDGKIVSEHKSQAEAQAAAKGGAKPDFFNKSKYQEVQMDEKEFQARIDAAVAAATKSYEDKIAAAVTSAKADAEATIKAQAERIAELERQNEKSQADARVVKIDTRLDKLSADGKITAPEKAMLKAVFSALPDAAVHTYSNDKNEEVKESVSETLWKMFESRNTKIFSEVARQGNETKTYHGNVQEQVVALANEKLAKDDKLTMTKAYSLVAKENPDLWRQYELDVKGKSH